MNTQQLFAMSTLVAQACDLLSSLDTPSEKQLSALLGDLKVQCQSLADRASDSPVVEIKEAQTGLSSLMEDVDRAIRRIKREMKASVNKSETVEENRACIHGLAMLDHLGVALDSLVQSFVAAVQTHHFQSLQSE